MSFNHRKSVTLHLVQAARAHRTRSGVLLGRIGLHAGQEAVLKALSEQDGQAMSELANALAVQPPTVTKMVSRLSQQGLVRRQVSPLDGRQARVFLTDEGRAKLEDVDKAMKRAEKEALAGFEDKDRRRLRKLLKLLEKNLAPTQDETETPDDDADEPLAVSAPESVGKAEAESSKSGSENPAPADSLNETPASLVND